ncbi:MAG TPA: hypothetical protein VLA83_07190 [Candidatus Binatia bacterium]|nr:hypothetical protein [Candidatus Binatia bacterium]
MMTGSTIYLKSAVAGLIAVMVALVAAVGAAIVSVIVMSRRASEDTSIGWDPVAFARDPVPWVVMSLVFVVGFWWKYRRLIAR